MFTLNINTNQNAQRPYQCSCTASIWLSILDIHTRNNTPAGIRPTQKQPYPSGAAWSCSFRHKTISRKINTVIELSHADMFTSCKVHKPSNHKMTSSICFEQDLACQTSPTRNQCFTECFHSNSTSGSCPQDRGWHTPVNTYHSVSVKKQRQGPVTQCHRRRQRQVTTVTQCHQNDKGHWPVTQGHQNDKGHWPVTQGHQSDKGQSRSVTKMTKATGRSQQSPKWQRPLTCHTVSPKWQKASHKVSPKWQRPLASHSSHQKDNSHWPVTKMTKASHSSHTVSLSMEMTHDI